MDITKKNVTISFVFLGSLFQLNCYKHVIRILLQVIKNKTRINMALRETQEMSSLLLFYKVSNLN